MAGRTAGVSLWNQLDTLAQLGVVGDLTDGRLLQQFLNGTERTAQAAFGVLVDRHGPMVLRVCRQLLGDSHRAEDACQATFLVLARKAGSVRKVDSVASWLHGVALKVAARTRAEAIRRRVHEQRGGAIKAAGLEEPREGDRAESWPELHEEIARLPARYRQAVVLCYLEGLTTEAAALRLGCPRGTILSRLSRARDRLRDRLARRGLAPVATMAWISRAEIPAPVPDSLVAAIKALAVAGAVGAGTIPISVLTLSSGVIHAMTFAKMIKTASLALGAAVLLGMGGAGVSAFQAQGGDGAAKAEVGPEPKPDSSPPVAPARRSPDIDFTEPIPAVEVVTNPELAAQLALARKKFARLQTLYERAAIPEGVRNEAEGEVKILEGRIAGRAQQLEEDLELLKIRLEGKKAEQDGAQAEVDAAKVSLASSNRLNQNKLVSEGELAQSEAKVRGKEATRSVRAAEVREIEVRIKHAERRLAGLAPLLKADDTRLEVLKQQEDKLSMRLKEVQRLVRGELDPALVSAKRQLEKIREEIRVLEAR